MSVFPTLIVLFGVLLQPNPVNPTEIMLFNENVRLIQESAANCVLSLAQNNFPEYSTLALVKSNRQYKTTLSLLLSTEDLILHQLIQSNSWAIMVKFIGLGMQESFVFGFEKVHNYVIVFQNLEDLEQVLVELSSATSWNPHGKFIGYVIGSPIDWEVFLTSAVRLLWKYWVINVVILCTPRERPGQVLITYYPYHGGDCGRQEKNFTIISQCVNSTIEPNMVNAFPEKVPKDMNHCLVKVGAIHSPPFVILNNTSTQQELSLDSGVEMALIKTIAESVNFDVELSMSYLESASEGSNTTGGLLKELAARNLDIAIGTISPTIAEHRRFDFSVQYTQDMATWIVPSDSMLPQWIGLLLVFQPTAYAATFLLLVFLWLSSSAIVRLVAFNFRREHRCYKYRGSFLFIVVGILFANVPDKFPRTRFLKCLVFIWILFCFYWNTAYNATLMSVVTNTVYTTGIETEQQILERGMNISVTNRTIRYFNGLVGEENRQSSSIRMGVCQQPEKCLLEISRTRESALAMSRVHFELVKGQYRDEVGNYQLKALKTNIVTSPIEMLFSKGHPLLPRIDHLVLMIKESGLIEYWTDFVTKGSSNKGVTNAEEKILTLANLKGAFLFLGSGYILACVAFVGEILVMRYKLN